MTTDRAIVTIFTENAKGQLRKSITARSLAALLKCPLREAGDILKGLVRAGVLTMPHRSRLADSNIKCMIHHEGAQQIIREAQNRIRSKSLDLASSPQLETTFSQDSCIDDAVAGLKRKRKTTSCVVEAPILQFGSPRIAKRRQMRRRQRRRRMLLSSHAN